jgi:hypothetical protein
MIYVVHPQPGATSTNSSSLLLSSVNLLHAQSHKILLRIGQEICTHLARSSFPELGYNTKPLLNLLQSLALSLASLTQHAQSMYNYHLHLALSTSHTCKNAYIVSLLTSPSFLFIHYKMGLNMGKPMGRHPHTRYISPKPKNP